MTDNIGVIRKRFMAGNATAQEVYDAEREHARDLSALRVEYPQFEITERGNVLIAVPTGIMVLISDTVSDLRGQFQLSRLA